MVFLTMYPSEVEHTREPSFESEFYWPPVFHLQPFSGLPQHSETPETGSISGSPDDTDVGESVSSQNSIPPSESEILLEHSASKHDEEVSNHQLGSGAASLLEEHIASSTAAGLDTESDQPKAIVDFYVLSPVATEELSMKKDSEVLAKPSSQEPSSVPLVNPEDSLDISETDTQIIGPSIAISCPAVVTAIDPPSTRLRHMIANSSSIILCPGVYDGLSARIAIHLGFKGMYMTGAGTTASCLGASDLGIAHLHDMRTNAEMIANLQPDGPPLIADMDTGYGGPLIISRSVKQYARAGVAAFHIEDQVPEKRCGHLSGKEVVDVDTYLRRIRACIDARAQIRSDIIIIARTDALQSRGYDDCIDRLRRARDLGADMGILEGVPSKEMAAQAVKDLAPWPLCYNSVENGHSPLITAAEAQEMGYRLMIFSFAGIAPAYMAIMETFTRLKEFGVTGSMVGPKKIFEVCGLEEEIRIDEAAGGSAFAKGV